MKISEPASLERPKSGADDPKAKSHRKSSPAPEARGQPLKVLIVEDSENDALLLEIELQRAGYEPICERVETRDGMTAALSRQRFDLVIADYVMPRFNGLEALTLVKAMGLDLPFIIVSGHITDNTAVGAMKAGAHDYVMKDNLTRLGSAVERELREAEGRRARRTADQKLKVEQVFREAIENSVPAGITAVDLDGRQTYVNPAFCAMVGWPPEELIGSQPPFVYWPPKEVELITEQLGKIIQGDASPGGLELRYCRRTGETIFVLVQVTPLKDAFGNITGWVTATSDISERKQADARLAAEHAITRVLANGPSLEGAAPSILQALLEGLDVDLAALWTFETSRDTLRISAVQLRDTSAELRIFQEKARQLDLKPGIGLAGRVWQTGRALWLSDLFEHSELPRRDPAVRAGLQSAMAFPIQNASGLIGVLEFFTRRRLEQDELLLNMMTAIGSEIGQFVQRRHAEEELRRAHDELEIRVQKRTAELKSANTKLHAAITERKRLENELLEITEKERRRLALDLHDDLGQRLSGIALMTKGLELKLTKLKADSAQEASHIHAMVQEAMTHASDLAHDLATLDTQKKTLPEALEELAARARELFGISCQFKHHGTVPALDSGPIEQLSKIAQEAVTNAIKHGKASRVLLTLATEPLRLTLTIDNNGLPFPDLQSHSTGMGLRIMNYRASLIGAELEIKAKSSDGTLVKCSMVLDTKR